MQIIAGGGLFFLPFSFFSFLPIPALSPSAHVGTKRKWNYRKQAPDGRAQRGCTGAAASCNAALAAPLLPHLQTSDQHYLCCSLQQRARRGQGEKTGDTANHVSQTRSHFSTGHFTVPNFPGNAHNMVGLHKRRMTICRLVFFFPSPSLSSPFLE